MSIQFEYSMAVDSLREALKRLESVDPSNLRLEDKWSIASATGFSFQASRSAAVLQGLVEATV